VTRCLRTLWHSCLPLHSCLFWTFLSVAHTAMGHMYVLPTSLRNLVSGAIFATNLLSLANWRQGTVYLCRLLHLHVATFLPATHTAYPPGGTRRRSHLLAKHMAPPPRAPAPARYVWRWLPYGWTLPGERRRSRHLTWHTHCRWLLDGWW